MIQKILSLAGTFIHLAFTYQVFVHWAGLASNRTGRDWTASRETRRRKERI